MKIIYVDNNDSFADTLASYFLLAGDSLKEKGSLNEEIDLKMYQSTCDLEVIVNENPDMIVLGSGPNSPKEAGNYLEILDKLHEDHAIFGICLGMQAMMHHAGYDVVRLKDIVHGATTHIRHTGTSFFEGIEDPAEFARYHSLGTYRDEMPEFDILATTPDKNGKEIIMAIEHKIYRYGGVQFHPESVLTLDKEYHLTLFENVIKKAMR